jgi:Ca2+-binding EF-hand superfamily protein
MRNVKRLIMMTTVLSASAAANPASGSAHEFKMMDVDKDGKISSQEHATGATSMFAKMDADKDGYVTAAEMTAAYKAVTGKDAKKSDMPAHDKIKVVDGDGDGKLSAAEHGAASASMFTKMDANKDGALTRQEMAAGHAAMLKKK